MKCIKCGTEIAAEQLFCPDCLEDMARHPVKQDTPLILPHQNVHAPVKRTPRRKTLKPEERISHLRKIIAVLLVLLMLLIATQTITVLMLLRSAEGKDIPFLPGQNYGTTAQTDPNTTP
jgi:membrane glycosyltransferase